MTLDCSLLTDGASDAALIPILTWVLRRSAPGAEIRCEWADLRHLLRPPKPLADRILAVVDLYPCDILFVHRDAESQPPRRRYDEITEAVAAARSRGFSLPHICVVPVRMQEAWYLVDESAIRRASGNPHGEMVLDLPALRDIESISDPKSLLHQALERASGRNRRRLKNFRPGLRTLLVTQHMRAFDRLRPLSAFQRLEREVQETITALALGGPAWSK